VAVEVADDGAGVPAEVAGRLFEPFVTTRAGGSGLGLAVVQRAVEAHGGVVLLDAGGAGAGARFTCVLPRAGRPAPEPAERPARRPAPV
jgi:signal transduction histidine kinase